MGGMGSMATLNQVDNPYVGPRTFRPEERAKFFGRSREARELTSLIIANRLVLFYSPSGAGKSSLLNTMVSPMLTEANFEVLPTGRVSGYSGTEATADNIYIYNLLLSIQDSEEIPTEFATLTLAQFLDNLVQHSDSAYYYDPDYVYPPDAAFKPRVLIIDQFEELVTTNPTLWPQRAAFFEQLTEALVRDKQLWVLLTLREDYVANLDPYLHLTPNRLRHRYYMERLTRPAAIEAMQKPVEEIRPFTPKAVELLADNLLRIRNTDGQVDGQLAQFVEPVQLQAVCYQMWSELSQQPGDSITTNDVARFADVDKALTNFYEEMIKRTVQEKSVSEVELRDWFDHELITEAGTRNIIYRGKEMSGSLSTEVTDYIRDHFILSEVVRPGGTWYELIHDRFTVPIKESNNSWRQQQPLIQLATQWDQAGRPKDRLLTGKQLVQLDPSNWQTLGLLVKEYVEAAQLAQLESERLQHEQKLEQERQRTEEAEQIAETQRRLKNRLAWVAGFSIIITIIALLFLNIAYQASQQESAARQQAEGNATLAVQALVTSESARATAAARGASLTSLLDDRESQLNEQLQALQALVPEIGATSPEPTQTEPTAQVTLDTPIQTTMTTAAIETSAAVVMQATVSAINLQLAQVRATQTAIAQELQPDTIIIGYSVQGKPIEAVKIGSGSTKIVFVGGIQSGIAPNTVTLGQELIDHYTLSIAEIPQGVTVIMVPNLNPDSSPTIGQLEGRYNANSVDLNRNWDCRWVSDPVIRNERRENAGGTQPNSEPETQALARFLLEEQPVAVIFWAGPDLTRPVFPGGCPFVKPETQMLANVYASASGYVEQVMEENIIEGDASNWLDTQGIPSIFVLLPGPYTTDFERNLRGVRQVIQYYNELQP
jgi:hypothetical protein